jgi:hypothetical protein
MKLGKNVITSQNDSNINSPEVVLEAATSQDPKSRYLVGNDAMKMMEKRKDTADEEFGRLVVRQGFLTDINLNNLFNSSDYIESCILI